VSPSIFCRTLDDNQASFPPYRRLDLVSLFVDVVVPRLIGMIEQSQKKLFEASMNGPTPDIPIQDIFSLYRRSKILLKMYHAFVPESVMFHLP
jgi:hypothetical protein